MRTIRHDIKNIKKVNKENIVASLLFGSFLKSPSKSNDVDLLFFVKEKKNFTIPKNLLNQVNRVQYNSYKSENSLGNQWGLDILIVDNEDSFEFVKKYNKNNYKLI